MKQRLLLALLVLFASVGMVKGDVIADITIAAPANSGDITVTLKGENVIYTPTQTTAEGLATELADAFPCTFGSVTPDPVVKRTLSSDKKTLTLVLPNQTTAANWVVKYDNTKTTLWNDITIASSQTKKITSVTIAASTPKKLVVKNEAVSTLSITTVTALAHLDIANNAIGTADYSNYSALTYLDCSNNKIKDELKLPNLPSSGKFSLKCTGNAITKITANNKELTGSDISLDSYTQYIEPSSTITADANAWIDMKAQVEKLDIFPNTALDKCAYRFERQNPESAAWAAVSSSEIHQNGTNNPTQYKFYSSKVYLPGTYRVIVTNSTAGYTGRTYYIPFTVTVPKFTLNVKVNTVDPHGSLKINKTIANSTTPEANITDVEQNVTIKLEATPDEGYVFDRYEVVGLEQPEAGKATVEVKVLGPVPTNTDQTIYAKAIFKAKQSKLKFVCGEHGSFTVTNKDGSKTYTEGEAVDVDTEIFVTVAPETNYVVEKITANGYDMNLVTGEENKYSYTIKTSANAETTIAASFKPKTTGLTMKINAPKDLYSKMGVSVNNGTALDLSSGSASVLNPTRNTTIKIEPKSGSKIVVNRVTLNNTIPLDNYMKLENGVYTLTYVLADDIEDAVITIEAVEANQLEVTLAGINGTTVTTQNFNYTGNTIDMPYTIVPAAAKVDLMYVKVDDFTDSKTDDEYTADKPKNAGKYLVKYKRAADADYPEIKLSDVTTPGQMEIKAVKLSLTTPAVKVVNEGGVLKYSFENQGSASFNGKGVAGKFVLSSNYNDKTKHNDYTASEGNAHLQSFSFVPSNETDAKNFSESKVNVSVKGTDGKKLDECTIQGNNIPSTIKVEIVNENTIVPLSTKIAKGSKIKLKFTTPNGIKVTTVKKDVAGAIETKTVTNNLSEEIVINGNYTFTIVTESVSTEKKEFTIEAADKEITYTGSVYNYAETVTVKDGTTTFVESTDYTKKITYKKGNAAVTVPKDQGVYDVIITVTPIGTRKDKYKETVATKKLTIKKAQVTIIEEPTASPVGKGSLLSSSVLTGGSASVRGSFDWQEADKDKTVPDAGGEYFVVFKPEDSNNYETATTSSKIKVDITDKATLSLAKDDTYTITAKGSDGKSYASGATVPVGTTLTFTVTPAATYKLKTLIVNGKEITGNTYKTTAGPISVKAEMIQEFTVTVTKPTRGIVVTLPSGNIVKKGESYSFTVAALAADMSRIVVKDGTTTVAGSNGRYTISNISENKAITITLDNPTAITVVADTTLSPGKKPMGTVAFTGLTDGKCYYNDRVTVKATPVSGVRFAGWTGTTETASSFTFTATAASYKFKALYSGSPVGVETIEGVKIYGSKGAIVVNCDSDAIVTIISMNGQSSKHEISGDTRIPANAGIYGVVLQKGSETIQTKVMVR